MQHLDFLSADEKDVYKTAFEIDQRWVIELAADRTPEVCQSQSVNLFLAADVEEVGPAHAALPGVGARLQVALLPAPKPVQRRCTPGGETHVAVDLSGAAKTDYEECLPPASRRRLPSLPRALPGAGERRAPLRRVRSCTLGGVLKSEGKRGFAAQFMHVADRLDSRKRRRVAYADFGEPLIGFATLAMQNT